MWVVAGSQFLLFQQCVPNCCKSLNLTEFKKEYLSNPIEEMIFDPNMSRPYMMLVIRFEQQFFT